MKENFTFKGMEPTSKETEDVTGVAQTTWHDFKNGKNVSKRTIAKVVKIVDHYVREDLLRKRIANEIKDERIRKNKSENIPKGLKPQLQSTKPLEINNFKCTGILPVDEGKRRFSLLGTDKCPECGRTIYHRQRKDGTNHFAGCSCKWTLTLTNDNIKIFLASKTV